MRQTHQWSDSASIALATAAVPVLCESPFAMARARSINAVNGGSTIITGNAGDMQGGLRDLKAGSVDQNGRWQDGGRFSAGGFHSVYGQGLDVGASVHSGSGSAEAGWHGTRAGSRSDWQGGADTVMVEGYSCRNNDELDHGRQYGRDLTGSWEHCLPNGSTLGVQTSYDQEKRYGLGGSDHKYSLCSWMAPPYNPKFDRGTQVVDRLPDPVVEGYVHANARIAWPTPAPALSLAGNDLPAACHVEPDAATLEIQRSILLGPRWNH